MLRTNKQTINKRTDSKIQAYSLYSFVINLRKLYTHADGSRVSKAIILVFLFVCLFVCPYDNSKKSDLKVFKLCTGNDLVIDEQMVT